MNAQTMKTVFSSKTCDWATPQILFDQLNAKYGPFDLDAAASEGNAKCARYFTEATNGLTRDWASQDHKKIWLNPPYGRHGGGIAAWVEKAYTESQRGATVCCLLPARTCTRWFHDFCYPEKAMHNVELVFLKGRVKFGGATTGAPFPSMVVIFRPPFAEVTLDDGRHQDPGHQ